MKESVTSDSAGTNGVLDGVAGVAQWPTSLDLWRGFLKSLLVCVGDRRAVGKQRLVLQKCSRL